MADPLPDSSAAAPGGALGSRRGRADLGADLGAALDALLPPLLERQPRALARAISLVEDGGPAQRELVRRLYPKVGKARVVGITGPPGSGKSTLVDRLARLCRTRDETVAILAVDPTSPFTGGAILGDRIRMQTLYTDPGVYIRSMATRGALGGLARASRDAIDVLDAAGFDWVLVETVGVGQDEVDVVRSVDSVAVVSVPGLGDDIQAIKAGILEIADVFVINKADRDGVDRTARDLEMMLSIGDHGDWIPPIVRTIANRGEGIEKLLEELLRHRTYLKASGEIVRRRRTQLRLRVETILKERVVAAADRVLGVENEVEKGFEAHLDPYAVADGLFSGVVRGASAAGRLEGSEGRDS